MPTESLPLTSDDITTLIRGITAAGTASGAGVTATMTAVSSTLHAIGNTPAMNLAGLQMACSILESPPALPSDWS